MSYQGTGISVIDANGRVALPAIFRKDTPTEKKFFISPAEEVLNGNEKHKILHLRRESDYNNFCERLLQLPRTSENYDLRRRVLKYTFEINLDEKQNRFLMPQELKAYAGIDKEAVFDGDGDKIIISNTENSAYFDLNKDMNFAGMEWL